MALNPRATHASENDDAVLAQSSSSPPLKNLPRWKPLEDYFPPFLLKKVVAEVIATFLLVFVTCGSAALSKSNEGLVSKLGASVAGGLIVTVMIYAVGHISGAHMNPAVTFAFAALRHFPWIQAISIQPETSWDLTVSALMVPKAGNGAMLVASVDGKLMTSLNTIALVPFYMAAQITGAMAASFTLRELLHPIADIGTTTPARTEAQALVMEIVVTFSMMFVTSAVATDTKTVGELAGLAVGSAVCITSILAGPISGGSMNPARSIGPALASETYDGLWVYVIGPVLGTLMGCGSYNLIRVPDEPSSSLTSQRQSSFKLRRLRSHEGSQASATSTDG